MARNPRWLREYLADQVHAPNQFIGEHTVGRLTEHEFKQMLEAATKTLPINLSWKELNAARVQYGDMGDPAECIVQEDAEAIRTANQFGNLEVCEAYARQIANEQGWVSSHQNLTDVATIEVENAAQDFSTSATIRFK